MALTSSSMLITPKELPTRRLIHTPIKVIVIVIVIKKIRLALVGDEVRAAREE